jgi:hypothetical protein
MKKQDLKALTSMAVDRAMAARRTAGVELTDEQTATVSGGAGLSYIKDPTWYGIWEVLKLPSQVQVGVVAQPIGIGPNEKLETGIAAGKVGF